MDILRCMDMFLITKLFRVYLFTVFTIRRPRTLASLALLGLLIVKTVTNIL